MKKRKLISFILVLCMLSTAVLTVGCDSGAGVGDITHRRAVTLTLYYIVGDTTTPEAIEMVERELNVLTQGRFTTRVVLRGLRASEYHDAVARAFANFDDEQAAAAEAESIRRSAERASRDQAREDRAAGIPTVRTPRPTQPPQTTALFTERIQWPDLRREQIDIFLITSDEWFMELLDEGRLEPLDDELNTRSKILREYIHPSTMMAGTHNGRTFAIPTNRAIGEAVWIAVNTRLAEQFAEFYLPDAEGEPVAHTFDPSRVRDARDLSNWLRAVRAANPGMAMFAGGPQYPLTFEPIFPHEEFPYFPIQANAGRSLVFTPEQMPTEPPPPTEPEPTEPPTDEEGNLLPTEEPTDPPETTIPAETLPPRPIPATLNMYTDAIVPSNQYTAAAWAAFAALNDSWREQGFFSNASTLDTEHAAFMLRGTLEDKLAHQAMDEINGFEYEYIMIVNPMATRAQLRSAMFGVSVSSPNVGRAMEIVTLLNTNRQFKNIFTYGIEGEHFIINDDRQIERISYDYMVDMSHTGNHFIADLLAGENPRKWDIAKEHNLNVVNSVFLNFNFDRDRLNAESQASLPRLQSLGLEVRNAFLNGLPSGFESWDDYMTSYVTPSFAAAGAPELLANIREQTSPE